MGVLLRGSYVWLVVFLGRTWAQGHEHKILGEEGAVVVPGNFGHVRGLGDHFVHCLVMQFVDDVSWHFGGV